MEQTELSKSLNVVYQPHPVAPIDGRKGMVCVTDGKATVRQVLLASGVDPHQPITIQLGGELLTVEEWDIICPTEGQLLSVQGTVQGGDGGSNPLQIVAIIAIAVVATIVTGGALAPVLGSSFAAGTIGAAVAGAVIGVAGSLLIGALFAPKPPTMPNALPQVSPTYSLAGGQNRARPYEPMPVVMGTHRLFFDYSSRPFTEYRGNDQYLYQIFNNSLGTVLSSDFKIGTTPLSSYTDVELIASNAEGKILNFPGNVDSSPGGALETENQTVDRTTSNNTYQIGFDFESVMFKVNTDGSFGQMSITLRIEYKQSGAASYQTPNPANVEIFGQNAYYDQNLFTTFNASQKPNRVTVYIKNLTPGTYDVRVTRITRVANQGETLNINWSVLRSYQLDDSDYKGQNRIGLIIKATEQLNGVVQQLSATTVAQATYWNGSAWVTGVTSNPAHWFMHFARGVYNADGKLMYGIGLSDSQIDLASLTAWASFCQTEGLTFNAVIDSTLTAADVLTMLGTAGFGSPSWASGKLGVVYDARNASPVMAFGMSNIIRDSFEVAYISENLADEIVVRFSNTAKDYEQDEVRVLTPGTTNPTRTSAIDLFGCTSATMAGKFANYVAAQQFYRRRRITWQSDFEGFVCQRGDVVLLSHDMTQWGYSGRFLSANNNIVKLDRSVPRQNQVEYLMLIRPDGTTTTYNVAATTQSESDELVIVDQIFQLQAGANLIDHRWAFSPLQTPGKRLKILSVQPASDARLQIVATDEYPEFYNGWDGTFVEPGEDTLLGNLSVSITNLTATVAATYVDGFIKNRVTARWEPSNGVLYSRLRAFFNGELIDEIPNYSLPFYQYDTDGFGTFKIELTPFGFSGAGFPISLDVAVTELSALGAPQNLQMVVAEDAKTATFTWDQVLGANGYEIKILVGGVPVRELNIGNSLSYTYTVDDAIADGGAFRNYTFRVYASTVKGISTNFSEITYSNPQIGFLQNISVTPLMVGIGFKCDRPFEKDFKAIRVWLSPSSGFTPNDSLVVHDGEQTKIEIMSDGAGNPLDPEALYYIKAAGYDTFGDDNLNISDEFTATTLSGVFSLVEGSINEDILASGLNDRIDLIDTTPLLEIDALTLTPNTGLISITRNLSSELSVIDTNVDTIGERLLEAALKIQDNTDLLYDAGVTVDSTTGEVYIYAVREQQNQLNEVGIRLDATEASLNLKASTVYVDNAIATAVIDPSQIAELGDIQARLASAEIDIDGLDAAITLKADLLTVQNQEVRLSTAEIDIDALEGQIVLKADNTELSSVEARVSTAEQTLNTLDVPSITQTVTDVRTLARDENQIAEAQLRDILTGQANYEELDFGIAKARQDLTAYVDEELNAEAALRLALEVQVNDNKAAIEEESVVRANAIEAEAQQRLALSAVVDQNSADILSETTARATADSALSSQITTLQATTASNTALIQTETIARTDADSALSSQITNIEALVGDNLAAIQSESIARADADSALASQITTLTSTVNGNTAAIQTEATTRANADSALASQITTLSSRVNNNTAAIQNEATTRANADSALSSNITTVQSSVNNLTTSVQTNASSINGINAKYTVKIDNNGFISGYGLISTANNATPTSTFIVKADRFAIGNVATPYNTNTSIPFFVLTSNQVINGVTISPGTYIKDANILNGSISNAKIANAAITNAKIGDLAVSSAKIQNAAVNTLQIADTAVTVPAYVSAGTSDLTLTYNLSGLAGTYQVFILGSMVQSYQSIIRLSVNGNLIWAEGPQGGTLATRGAVVSLGTGVHTIRLWSTDTRNINGTSIYALATKR